MRQVFLSYAMKHNKAEARRLYEELNASPDIHVWFDKVDLLPGMKWRPAIRKAIRESRYFIALLSKNSVTEKGFRQSELRQALEIMEEFPDDQIFLIPTRLDECEMPIEALQELNYADLFPTWEDGIDRLRKSLRISRPVAAPIKVTTQRKRILREETRVTKHPPERAPVGEYHYRVGLVDLDARLSGLRKVARGLNEVQRHFYFKTSALSPSRKALRTKGGIPQLYIDHLSSIFYKKISPLRMDRVICLTNRLLMFGDEDDPSYNYLGVNSPVDERVRFSSVRGLEDYAEKAGVPFEVAVGYVLVSELTPFFLDIDYHRAIRGCPFDFTEVHEDMVKGLANGRFCAHCLGKLKQNPALREAVTAMLGWGRQTS